MKKIFAVILSAVIIATALAACSKPENTESTTDKAETTATTSTTVTTQKESTSEAETTKTTVKETKKEKKKDKEKGFKDWKIKDLAKYFEDEKVLTNKDWLDITDDVESLPDGVSGEIEYNNHNNDDVNVLIFYLDEDSDNKKTKEIYNKIKSDKYFEWEDGGRQQPFNALIGRFAIFYSASVDESFVKKFEKALDKLIKEKKLSPDFYEKDIDLTKYKDDDDVIIIEADD